MESHYLSSPATLPRRSLEYCDLNGHTVRSYKIQTSQIPVLNFDDPKTSALISAQEPVVIKNLGLIEPALKWDLDYLKENIGHAESTVYLSSDEKFMYFDEKRCTGKYADFNAPSSKSMMTFQEFYDMFKSWKEGDKRIYYQQMLTSSVSNTVVMDFLAFNWKWLSSQQEKNRWGPLSSNLLLVAQPGNITPCHYDEQENFFAQAKGCKRCILFAPSQFKCLYPFPFHHPCDRQSQVDFGNPNLEKFPLFSKVCGREAIIGPGDVLYIPVYWWHYIESVMNGEETVSINFWYKAMASSVKNIPFPLDASQKVAVMRNVEKLLGDALGSSDEIGSLLNTIVRGRYPDEEQVTENSFAVSETT